MFRAPKDDPDAYERFIKALAGKIKTTADASPTDLKRYSEGLRQFAAIFGMSGGNIDEANALLGTATTMGQNDVEVGTALKQGLVRFINPTSQATASFSRQGLDRSKYMDVVPQDPIKATNQLINQFSGYISRNSRREMRTIIEKAIKSGNVLSAIDPITALITKSGRGGLKHEDVQLAVANTITTSGTRFDFYRYLRETAEALKSGKIGMADIIARFTGFHASKVLAILSRPDLLDFFLKLSRDDDGSSQDVRKQAFDESRYGKWSRVKAAADRMLVNVGGSDLVLNLVEWLEHVGERISNGEGFAPGVDFGKWLGDKTREQFEALRERFSDIPRFFDGIAEAVAQFVARLGAAKDALLSGRFKDALDYLAGKKEALDRVPGPSGPSVPLISPNAAAQRQQVDVEGQAQVKVQSEVIVRFENGIPVVTGNQGGDAETKVPLRTGTSMGDLGVP